MTLNVNMLQSDARPIEIVEPSVKCIKYQEDGLKCVTLKIGGVSRSLGVFVSGMNGAVTYHPEIIKPSDIKAVIPEMVRSWPGIKDEQGNYHPNEFSEMVRFARNTYEKLFRIFKAKKADHIDDEEIFHIAATILPDCTATTVVVMAPLDNWMSFIESNYKSTSSDARELISMIFGELSTYFGDKLVEKA